MRFKVSDLWKNRRHSRAEGDPPHAGEGSEESSKELNHQSLSGKVLEAPLLAFESDEETGIKADIDMAVLLKHKVPPLPNAALRVSELARDMNASAATVADAVGYDPLLAARILRAANSPLYSRERHVTALTTAVNILGLRTLYQLTISYAASSLFDRQKSPSLFERTIWKHSVFVGLVAREISLGCGLHGSEEAFLCGLLHDIGKILMIQHDARLYAPLEAILDEKQLLAGEREVYGFTHAQVGALVIDQWGIAPEISDAILNHHAPDEAIHSILTTRVLNIADKLANTSGFGVRQESSDCLATDESVFLLELSSERLQEIQEKAEERMSEMMYILSK